MDLRDLNIENLEKDIHRIERSTRTLFRFMRKPHNHLCSKLNWYYQWHMHPLAHLTHWFALAGYTTGMVLFVFMTVFGTKALETRAASAQTWATQESWSAWKLDSLSTGSDGLTLTNTSADVTVVSYPESGTATITYKPNGDEVVDWLSTEQTENLNGGSIAKEYSTDNILFTPDISTLADSATLYIKLSFGTPNSTVTPVLNALTINYSRLPNAPNNLAFKFDKGVLGTKQILSAGTFSDPDNDLHQGSQWQITGSAGDYTKAKLLFDSGTFESKNPSDLTSYTLAKNLPEGSYYFHTRYEDSVGAWSNWSAECAFTIEKTADQQNKIVEKITGPKLTTNTLGDSQILENKNEILDKRTDKTKTIDNKNGTYTQETYGGMIHYKENYQDPASSWLDINPNHSVDTPGYVLYDQMPSTVKVFKDKIGYEIESRASGEKYTVELQSVDGAPELSRGTGSSSYSSSDSEKSRSSQLSASNNRLVSWADINPPSYSSSGSEKSKDDSSRLAASNNKLADWILPSALADEPAVTADNGNLKFEFQISENGVRLWKTIKGDDAPKNFTWNITKTVGTKSNISDLKFRNNPEAFEISATGKELKDSQVTIETKKTEVKNQQSNNGTIEQSSFTWQETAPQTDLKIDTDVTYYPDADAETTTVDGMVQTYGDGAGGGPTWSGLVNAAGIGANDSGTVPPAVWLMAWPGTPGSWWQINRGIFLFDITSIPADQAITAATFSVYGEAKTDGLGILPDINVFSAAPAANTSLTATDYATLGTTAYSTAIPYNSISVGGYNAFALNATGLAAVSAAYSGAKIVKLGLRNGNYDAANIEPAWSDESSRLDFIFAEDGLPLETSKLTVTYAAPSSSTLDAGTVAEGAGGSYSWSTPENARVSDGNFATVTPQCSATMSNYLVADNFGFAIPTGSTIYGIKAEVEWQHGMSMAYDRAAYIIKSDATWGNYNLSPGNNVPPTSPAKAYVAYGGSSDLWTGGGIDPITWTAADINDADFGFAFSVENNCCSMNLDVDNMRITVYYVAPPVVAPTVTTQAADGIGRTTATGNGNITDTGGATADVRGFEYKADDSVGHDCTGDLTSPSTSYDAVGGYGTGAYTKGISGLTASTYYCDRAYATNSAGTGYGAWTSYQTSPPYTISGTAYTSDTKSATVTDGTTVGLSINGGVKATTTTTTGVFTFTSPTVTTNDTLTFYLAGGTYEGNLVTQAADGTTSISGLEIYANDIVLSHQTAGPMTNTLLNTANNCADCGTSIHYTDDGGFDTAYKLWIASGKTYTPGGSASFGTIANKGTFNPEGNTVTVSGSWDGTSGTVNPSTSTVNFTATSGTVDIASGGQAFKNISFNDSAGTATYRPTNALDVNGTFTLTSGTLDLDTNDPTVNIAGNISLAGGSITKSSTGALVTFDGDMSYSSAIGWSGNFGAVKIGHSPDTTTLITDFSADSLVIDTGDTLITDGYNVSITGDITVNGTFDATHNGARTSTIICDGNWATGGSGVFTADDSTVSFEKAGDQTVNSGGNSFYNMRKYDSGDLQVVTSALTVTGTLWLAYGNFDQNGQTVSVGTLSNDTIFKRKGTESLTITTMDTDSGQFVYYGNNVAESLTIKDFGATDYYDLKINDVNASSATYILGADLKVARNLEIVDGTMQFTSAYNINLAGSLTIRVDGAVTKGTGLLTFDGSGSSQIIEREAVPSDLGLVKIDGTTKTITTDCDNGVKVTKLEIGADDTFQPGVTNTVFITGSGTGASRPFLVNNGGTLTEQSSTFVFTGTAESDIQAETYYNLQFKPTSGSPTYHLGTATSQTLTVLGLFTVGNGTNVVTADANTYDPAQSFVRLNIAANAVYSASATSDLVINSQSNNPDLEISASATFTPNGGTVKYVAAAGTGTIQLYGTALYNFVIDRTESSASDSTLMVASDFTANDLTVSNNNGSSGALTIYGTSTITVNNDLTFPTTASTAGVSFGGSDNPSTVLLAGDLAITDANVTFYPDITFNGSGAQAFSKHASATVTYGTGGGGTWTVNKSNTLTLNSDLSASFTAFNLTAGTFDVGIKNFTMSAGLFVQGGGTFNGNASTISLIGLDQNAGTYNSTSGDLTVGAGSIDLTGTGTFVHDSGTVILTEASQTLTSDSQHFYNLTATNTWTLGDDLYIENDFTASGSGAITTSGFNTTVERNFYNTPGNGFVTGTLYCADATRPSNFVGYVGGANFSCTVPGKTLAFKSGAQQSFGNFTLTGSSGSHIVLTRHTGDVQWEMTYSGVATVSYVTVYDSKNNGTLIDATTGGTDGNGNNIGWDFGIVAPTVTTAAATDLASTSVTGNGEVTADGGDTVTGRGFYNVIDNSVFHDCSAAAGGAQTTAGDGTGIYSASIGSLAANTYYCYRAYATNSADTGYGSWTSYQTSSPSVAFTATSSSGAESVTPADLEVSLSAISGTNVTVDYTVTGGTATGSGTDYTLAAGTLTITAGNLTGNISPTIVDDTLDENNETIIVTISNPFNATLGANTIHTYTINDNDTSPTVAFTATTSNDTEATTSKNLEITISAVSGRNVTVDYAVTGGTATGTGTDYTLASGTATVTAGSTTTNIALTIVNDTLDETDETVEVTLSNPIYSTLGTNTIHTYTITDNDNPPMVTLELTGSPLAEAAGAATVTARLDTASGKDVTVYLAFTGTATNITDYTRSDTSIVIGAGTTSNAITLTAVSDSLDENNETVIVDIDSVTNGTETDTQQVTATINDDDAAPTIQLTATSASGLESVLSKNIEVYLDVVSGLNATVDYAVTGGTATGSGTDYTLASGTATVTAGSTTTNIALTIVNDTMDENDETVVITISGPSNATLGVNNVYTYTITDNDTAPTVAFTTTTSNGSEATTPANLEVSLSAVSGKDITADYAVTGGTATGSGTDYTLASGTATITAGSTTTNIALTIVNDTLDENNEIVIVTISNPGNATLGVNTAHTYTINDDDNPPSVTLSANNATIGESGGTSTVTATLSAVSTLDVTVHLAFTGTATNVTDYTRSGTTIAIGAGTSSNAIILTGVADMLVDDGETILTDISSVDNGTESGTQQATVTITDGNSALTATAGTGGTITPGTTVVLNGASQSFAIAASAGYRIYDVLVDSVSVGAVDSYDFTNVTTDHTIAASFIKRWTVTGAKSGVGDGTFSPALPVTVDEGSEVNVTAVPNASSDFSSWTGCDTVTGAVCTISAIAEDKTITAAFAVKALTLTSSVHGSTGGTVSPLGSTAKSYGDSITYTFTPSDGYQIDTVSLDGISLGALTSYTISPITTNHTILVTYALIVVAPPAVTEGFRVTAPVPDFSYSIYRGQTIRWSASTTTSAGFNYYNVMYRINNGDWLQLVRRSKSYLVANVSISDDALCDNLPSDISIKIQALKVARGVETVLEETAPITGTLYMPEINLRLRNGSNANKAVPATNILRWGSIFNYVPWIYSSDLAYTYQPRGQFSWSSLAEAGTIDQSGSFTASNNVGTYYNGVTAEATLCGKSTITTNTIKIIDEAPYLDRFAFTTYGSITDVNSTDPTKNSTDATTSFYDQYGGVLNKTTADTVRQTITWKSNFPDALEVVKQANGNARVIGKKAGCYAFAIVATFDYNGRHFEYARGWSALAGGTAAVADAPTGTPVLTKIALSSRIYHILSGSAVTLSYAFSDQYKKSYPVDLSKRSFTVYDSAGNLTDKATVTTAGVFSASVKDTYKVVLTAVDPNDVTKSFSTSINLTVGDEASKPTDIIFYYGESNFKINKRAGGYGFLQVQFNDQFKLPYFPGTIPVQVRINNQAPFVVYNSYINYASIKIANADVSTGIYNGAATVYFNWGGQEISRTIDVEVGDYEFGTCQTVKDTTPDDSAIVDPIYPPDDPPVEPPIEPDGPIAKVAAAFVDVATNIGTFIQDILAKIGLKPLSASVVGVVASVLAVAMALAAIPLASMSATMSFGEIGRSILEAIGNVTTKRHRKKWGKIVDQESGLPVMGVKITLIKIYRDDPNLPFENMKPVGVAYADKFGRYGFIAEPGKYKLEITKDKYSIVEGNSFLDFYHPNTLLEVKNYGDGLVVKDIAMSPDKIGDDGAVKKVALLEAFGKIAGYLSVAFLIFGTITVIPLILKSNLYIQILLIALYLYLWLINIKLVLRRSPWGMVSDHENLPVGLALVRIVDHEKNVVVRTVATNGQGRFSALADKGKYDIRATKQGYQQAKPETMDISQDMSAVNKKIILKKL